MQNKIKTLRTSIVYYLFKTKYYDDLTIMLVEFEGFIENCDDLNDTKIYIIKRKEEYNLIIYKAFDKGYIDYQIYLYLIYMMNLTMLCILS